MPIDPILAHVNQARHALTQRFPQPICRKRLQTLRITPFSPKHSLGPKNRAPGYYDPNTHTIWLNCLVLNAISVPHRTRVFYHELIHALSYHETYHTQGQKIFQSGIKMEMYRGQNYSYKNRAFNEGIVQHITNTLVNYADRAYYNEALIIQTLIPTIGLAPIEDALVHGTVEALEQTIDARFMPGIFDQLSYLAETRRFMEAHALLTPQAAVNLQPVALSM